MTVSAPHLILASASPRRRELLALFGLPFTVEPSRFEEPPPPVEPTRLSDLVTGLAASKAGEVAARMPDSLVLGADTLVAPDAEVGVPLGKPTDADDARRMLRLLSGRTHRVYTGVALIKGGQSPIPILHTEMTRVRFRPLTAAMIEGYLATGEPFDKAGAYGAQGCAAPFIEGIEGDFFNVVGLPLCALGRLLEQVGVDWQHLRRL